MAKPEAQCIVRWAKSSEEAKDIFWEMVSYYKWERSNHDGFTHYQTAPGILVAVPAQPNQDGKLVESPGAKPQGCIVPFCHESTKTGWIGFFCMKDELRGKGWGTKLWDACMAVFESQSIKVVGLDAVAEQVPRYSKSGFVDKGRVRLMARAHLGTNPLGVQEVVVVEGLNIVDIKDIPSNWLIDSDHQITGFKREKLWTNDALFSREDVFGFAVVEHKKETAKDLKGWIIVRSCEHGFRFGPLYAESPSIATSLLRKAMLTVPKEIEPKATFITEAWQENKTAIKVFEDEGWKWVGIDYHRMWLNGTVPKEQAEGGAAETTMFAEFDAGQG